VWLKTSMQQQQCFIAVSQRILECTSTHGFRKDDSKANTQDRLYADNPTKLEVWPAVCYKAFANSRVVAENP
jgi:hypothetical protein